MMSKKGKGFGQSPTPTRKFKDFILAFGDCYRKNSRDTTKLQQFLKANINKLNDLLLDALPLVFTSLIADKFIDEQEEIAYLFEIFATTVQEFPFGDRAMAIYRQLQQPVKVEEVNSIYQAALRAIERQTAEVSV
jgi:hypothetical protein